MFFELITLHNPSNGKTMETIQAERRIELRKFQESDLDAFYVWASDPEVTKTMTWEAYTSKPEALKFLKEVVLSHNWFMAICVNGVPVGSITLTQGKGSSFCKAELGYVIAKKFWGKGIATYAVQQALEHGFKELGVRRIEAFVDPENLPSRRVLEKVGMHCEGLLKNYIVFKGSLRDRYIYAVTR